MQAGCLRTARRDAGAPAAFRSVNRQGRSLCHEFGFDRWLRRDFARSVISACRGNLRIIHGARLLLAYIGQPWARSFALAGSDLEEHLLNLRRDFAALAAADLNPINRSNRSDFSRRATEENFISDINRRALNRALFHGKSELLSDLQDAVAGDARQH